MIIVTSNLTVWFRPSVIQSQMVPMEYPVTLLKGLLAKSTQELGGVIFGIFIIGLYLCVTEE